MRLVAGDKYSYREMDDFTDRIEKGLKGVPQASKVSRSGILPEKVFLLYSQERIASYGLKPGDLPNILAARNITPRLHDEGTLRELLRIKIAKTWEGALEHPASYPVSGDTCNRAMASPTV